MSTTSQNNTPIMGAVASEVEKETYYHGLLPREDVRLILESNGDFLVRSSEPKAGEPRSYILSVMWNNQLEDLNALKHFVINTGQGKFWITTTVSFDTISAMINNYLSTKAEILDGVKIVKPVGRQYWELFQDQIKIEKKLGEGAFGEVSMGVMTFPKSKSKKSIPVAVKQAKLEKMGKEQIKDFMNEARSMRKLGHQNVVKFYGVAVLQEPLYLVMELASNGALDSYLKKTENISAATLNEMLLQAAWGLEYLHGKPMLHRDIAARNCLYGDGKVKISDFGLTRTGTFYQMRGSSKVPIRWLAVETLKTFIYTQKTDVWSYGILAWEIYNAGAEPYPGMSVAEVATGVQAGFRMQLPPHVNPEIQALIARCNSDNPNDRPTMGDIAVILQRITAIARPNFAEIAKKEAAELLMLNDPVRVKAATQRRKKSVGGGRGHLPKGMHR